MDEVEMWVGIVQRSLNTTGTVLVFIFYGPAPRTCPYIAIISLSQRHHDVCSMHTVFGTKNSVTLNM